MSQDDDIDRRELPEPPYPPNTTTNGWKPLIDLPRIKASRTWLLCPQQYRPWLLLLWVECWDSIPAGSMPDDDELIAIRLGMEFGEFERAKRYLLRGWRLHSDGNLYHAYITDQVVNDMLKKRRLSAERVRRHRWKRPAGSESGDAEGESSQKRLESEEKDPETRNTEDVTRYNTDGNALHGGCNATDRTGRDRTGQDSTSGLPFLSGKPAAPGFPDHAPIPTAEQAGKPAAVAPGNRKPKPPIADVETVIDYLNQRTGRRYQTRNNDGELSSSADLVRKRLAEHDLRDLLAVIDLKVRQWGDDDRMAPYLRPATLFGKQKCEQYVGELGAPGAVQRKRNAYDEWLARRGFGSAVKSGNVIEGRFTRDD